MPDLAFSINDAFLRVSITGWERPTSSDYWDGNWLNTVVEFRTRSFHGGFHCTLRAEEFPSFRRGLESLKNREHLLAKFETMERQVRLEFQRDRADQVHMRAELKDHAGGGDTVILKLALSEDALIRTLTDVDALTSIFPVRGSPRGQS